MSKTSQDSTNHDHEAMKQLIAVFEQMYTERMVYKAIAERDPGCNALAEALKADPGIREKISRTFTPVYECIGLNQGLMKLLESLPLMGSKPANGASTALAARK
jgi:hypothetical protein